MITVLGNAAMYVANRGVLQWTEWPCPGYVSKVGQRRPDADSGSRVHRPSHRSAPARWQNHTPYTHSFNGHFPCKRGLAGCPPPWFSLSNHLYAQHHPRTIILHIILPEWIIYSSIGLKETNCLDVTYRHAVMGVDFHGGKLLLHDLSPDFILLLVRKQ